MNNMTSQSIPPQISQIEKETKASGFSMASDYETGSLLRTLVATKKQGDILELGTGTGLSTCWLLDGMDGDSQLTSVDNDASVMQIAQKHLSNNPKVKFYLMEGTEFLKSQEGKQYDLIFADTWPGKFSDLDTTLNLLKPGGLYIIDDMLPQMNWPEDHSEKVNRLIEDLDNRQGYLITKLTWSTGIILVTKI